MSSIPARGAPAVTKVRFSQAPASSHASGLLGHVSFVAFDTFHFDHIAVRRTLAGPLSLSYRAIELPSGDRHYPVRPTGEPARIAIEKQVFGELRSRGILP